MNTHSLFSYDFPKRSIIASATTLKKPAIRRVQNVKYFCE